mgnify:CR=1 FL=1
MIHFAHPTIFYLLFVVALLCCLWFLMRVVRRRQADRFADRSLIQRLMPEVSPANPAIKFVLLTLSAIFLIVTLANPLMGSHRVKGEHVGGDVAICLDISNSMMAEDVQPNRLDRAKRLVSRMLEHMAGDRVSLVVFAGSSFVQMPLTNDYGATRLFLDQIDCSMIAAQGTAIGDAIGKAMLSLGYGEEGWDDEKAGRAIVIISDGENHEDDALQAARDAASEGVIVCTVGMGLADGAPIPQYDRNGNRIGLKRDVEGNTVMTHLSETMLRDIAQAGGGVYLHGSDINADMGDLYKTLERLEKRHYDEFQFDQYQSQYQYPLALALIFLVAELCLFERRCLRRRPHRHLALLLLIVLLPTAVQAQNRGSHKSLRQGERQYRKGHFTEAVERFRAAKQADSSYWVSRFNLGNALYRNGHYDAAAEQFGCALEDVHIDTVQRSHILRNRGNAYLKEALATPQDDTTNQKVQFLHQAINDYQEALKMTPKDDDTRYNLAYALHLLPKSDGGGNNQNQQDQQQNQQQDQQKGQNSQNNQNQQGQQQNQQNGEENKNQQNQQDQQQNQQKGQQDQQKNQQSQEQQGKNGQGAQKQQQKQMDAERMLRAVENNEKNSLREHRGKLQAGSVKRTDKDW